MDDKDLTGEWTGIYDYPDGESEPVPFQAFMTEVNGQITGELSEPNTFVKGGGLRLYSMITGARSGDMVTFLKIYEGYGDTDSYEISYQGNVNADLTVINGTWTTIEDTPWSGPFVMNRPKKATQKTEDKISDALPVR